MQNANGNSKAIQKMDAKNGRTNTSAKRSDGKQLLAFFSDVKQELKKVDWTSKDELRSYTKIVLISTLVFGMFIYFVDLIIQGFLGGIQALVRFFIG